MRRSVTVLSLATLAACGSSAGLQADAAAPSHDGARVDDRSAPPDDLPPDASAACSDACSDATSTGPATDASSARGANDANGTVMRRPSSEEHRHRLPRGSPSRRRP
jgi:hypothetical protein